MIYQAESYQTLASLGMPTSGSYTTQMFNIADWLENLDKRFYDHRGLPQMIRSYIKYDPQGEPLFVANFSDIIEVIYDVVVFGRSLGWLAKNKQEWLEIIPYDDPEYISISNIMEFLTIKN